MVRTHLFNIFKSGLLTWETKAVEPLKNPLIPDKTSYIK